MAEQQELSSDAETKLRRGCASIAAELIEEFVTTMVQDLPPLNPGQTAFCDAMMDLATKVRLDAGVQLGEPGDLPTMRQAPDHVRSLRHLQSFN